MRSRAPDKPKVEISERDRSSWAHAVQDVRPLKGKRRILKPIDPLLLKLKPIKAKTPLLRVAAKSLYDGKLDLHGLTEMGAHRLLMEFMQNEIRRQSKKLLIITGKGGPKGNEGALKNGVPRWLDVEPIASAIRSVELAPPNLGADGAYLVTLRQKRK